MDYARLADLYDLFVTTDDDLPFFRDRAKTCRRVLELMAGTGRLSIPLLEQGVNLTCLDSSPEMLSQLRGKLRLKGLKADVIEADATGFSLPETFDLIFIAFNSFSEIVGRESQRSALATIRRHLAPGGRAIITLQNPSMRLALIDGQPHVRGKFPLPDGRGQLVVTTVEHYDERSAMVSGREVLTLFDTRGVLKEERQIGLTFQLHTRSSMEELLTETGYHVVEVLGDYSGIQFESRSSPSMIWILG